MSPNPPPMAASPNPLAPSSRGMASAAATKSKFKTLNGLRALFLIWVLFYHLPDSALGAIAGAIRSHLSFGVDGFLAISGFLVTRSLYECDIAARALGRAPSWAMRDFVTRRLSRIVPSYYLVLIVLCLIAVAGDNFVRAALAPMRDLLPSFFLFFANYTIPVNDERIPVAVGLWWSVSFQEQFYLLLVLIYRYAARHIRAILLAGAIGSAAWRMIMLLFFWRGEARSWEIQGWLHLNFDAVAWGCLAWLYYEELGVLWSTRRRAIVSSTLILTGLALSIALQRSIWYSDIAVGGFAVIKAPLLALLVRMACEIEVRRGPFAKFLSHRTFGTLSLISYETYLVHGFVYGFIESMGLKNGLPFVLVAWPLSLAVGYALNVAVGRPAQRWLKDTLTPAPMVA